jgi:hypothetical protein
MTCGFLFLLANIGRGNLISPPQNRLREPPSPSPKQAEGTFPQMIQNDCTYFKILFQ